MTKTEQIKCLQETIRRPESEITDLKATVKHREDRARRYNLLDVLRGHEIILRLRKALSDIAERDCNQQGQIAIRALEESDPRSPNFKPTEVP